LFVPSRTNVCTVTAVFGFLKVTDVVLAAATPSVVHDPTAFR
jgi:hypothetical protein